MQYSILLSLLIFSSFVNSQEDVVIAVTDLRSNKGNIIVAVFEDEKSFQDETPKTYKTFKKSNVNNGKLNLKFKLPAGS